MATSSNVITSNMFEGEYQGDILDGRFCGQGILKFKDGRKYEGNFFDGLFHGEGTLFVHGGSFVGFWERGNLVEGGFVFQDGLKYRDVTADEWDYCTSRDPRFHSEIVQGKELGDRLTQISPFPQPPPIPQGCYDTVDGYYDPRRNGIYSSDIHELKRKPDEAEVIWITMNCRLVK